MQVSSSIANTGSFTNFRVAGSANDANAQTKVKSENSKDGNKESKNISMADSELVQKANRTENIIKRFEKQKELVRNQIENVNKNQLLTVDEKKEKVAELTEKIKMLEDEKNAAIYEENQKKLEEEKRKREEQKEKKEIKEESNKEAEQVEGVKDMEHILKISHNYSRITRFKQAKANMEREAGRLGGEIANDIMSSGVTESYSEAKVKAATGVNPYRDNDWKIMHFNKLTTGISNLENSIIDEVTKVNKETKRYGKLKVEFAKEEVKNDKDEEKVVTEDNETAVKSAAPEETKPESEAAEQNALPQEQDKQESKVVSEAHSKYKKTDGKHIDKKGHVIDTDL